MHRLISQDIETGGSMHYFLSLAALFWLKDAYAYLDAGTGSLLLQSTIASLVTGIFIIKNYWTTFKRRFFFKKDKEDNQDENFSNE